MNLEHPKYLARALLNREIHYPTDHPTDPSAPPREVTERLEAVLAMMLPDVLAGDPTTYGPSERAAIADYQATLHAIKTLSVTGIADRDTLGRGEAALEPLIRRLMLDEAGARFMLGPDSEGALLAHGRLGWNAHQISRDRHETYFSYLVFSGTRSALEVLRDGLRDLNQALDRGPLRPPRAR